MRFPFPNFGVVCERGLSFDELDISPALPDTIAQAFLTPGPPAERENFNITNRSYQSNRSRAGASHTFCM
jgi:hypothetical protein